MGPKLIRKLEVSYNSLLFTLLGLIFLIASHLYFGLEGVEKIVAFLWSLGLLWLLYNYYISYTRLELYPDRLEIYQGKKKVKVLLYKNIESIELQTFLTHTIHIHEHDYTLKVPVIVERPDYILNAIEAYDPKLKGMNKKEKFQQSLYAKVYTKLTTPKLLLGTISVVILSVITWYVWTFFKSQEVSNLLGSLYSFKPNSNQRSLFMGSGIYLIKAILYYYFISMIIFAIARKLFNASKDQFQLRSSLKSFKKLNWALSIIAICGLSIYGAQKSMDYSIAKDGSVTFNNYHKKIDVKYNCFNCNYSIEVGDKLAFFKGRKELAQGRVLAVPGPNQLVRKIASDFISDKAKLNIIGDDEILLYRKWKHQYVTIKFSDAVKNLQKILKFKKGQTIWFKPNSKVGIKYKGKYDVVGLAGEKYVTMFGRVQSLKSLEKEGFIKFFNEHEEDGKLYVNYRFDLNKIKLKNKALVLLEDKSFKLIPMSKALGKVVN